MMCATSSNSLNYSPPAVLDSASSVFSATPTTSTSHTLSSISKPIIGIGLDSCVIPLRHGGLHLIQTTDFFYPLIDDPYTMGRITCANVLSDLYAMGVTECDNMLMLLGVSNKLSADEREVVVKLIMRGFRDCAAEAGTSIQGGQTVVNPWMVIGGVATSVCLPTEYCQPDRAVPGDVLVLTKALGTQVAVNVHQWLVEQSDRWRQVSEVITEQQARQAYQSAARQMARLNRTAARLMRQYNAHACTDVTGFGLLGHAKNLAACQKADVAMVVHNLPILAGMASVSTHLGGAFGLLRGTSAETSGGLLVAMTRADAAEYCKALEATSSADGGGQAWIVGVVEAGSRTAAVSDKPRIIEVSSSDSVE